MNTTVPTDHVTRIFSFGHGQRCPFTGRNLIDHHVTVTAPTAALCRDLMVATFGLAWAFEYVSLDAATRNGQFPSTEHVRISMPLPAVDPTGMGYSREADDPTPGDVPSGVEGGSVTGRASVPDMQTDLVRCVADVSGYGVCGEPIYWHAVADAWWHQEAGRHFNHMATGPSVPPEGGE